MPQAGFYRSEAKRCRALAAATSDTGMAERWRAMAREYEMLAEALDVQSHVARPSPPSGAAQSQPMQQQQAKKTEE